jgi:integrase
VIIRMSQPWRHPKTGILYFRSRLPADVAESLAGRSYTLDVAGGATTVRLNGWIKVSLRTKDVREARLRHASVQAQIQSRWQAARNGTQALTHKQVLEIAGEWYRDLVRDHEDEPGDVEQWELYQELLSDAADEPNRTRAAQGLSKLIHLDPWLEARGYNLDQETREKVLLAVSAALFSGAETIKRRAGGDYGPDEKLQFYPVSKRNTSSNDLRGGGNIRIADFFEGWAKEVAPAEKTVAEWRKHIRSFIEFVGHDDPRAVSRSHVVNWKQHLLDLGNSPKTISGSKLAALKSVLGWAVENGHLETNPAAGVSVRRGTKVGSRMRGFERAEAAAILQASAREKSPVYRWVPLLCAQAGARVSEICQLRVEDIREDGGIWFMDIKAEAGSLKTHSSERQVPLHPHVMDAGFLDFVRSKRSGPLFFDPKRRRDEAARPQPKIVAKNVAAWVHRLGLDVGRQHRKDPNHGWRHLFRTLATEAGVQSNVIAAIQGHAPSSVGEGYGEVPLISKDRAIRLLPLPGVLPSE